MTLQAIVRSRAGAVTSVRLLAARAAAAPVLLPTPRQNSSLASSPAVPSSSAAATASISSSSASSSSAPSPYTEGRPERGQPARAVPPIARTDPEIYASLLPQPTSQLHTLLARLNLPTNDPELLRQLVVALTHPSWISQRDHAMDRRRTELGETLGVALERSRSSVGPQSHGELSTLGNTLLGLLTSENLHLTYPNLPNRALKAALSAHAGPQSLAEVGVELGLGAKGLVKWDRSARVKTKLGQMRALTSREVLADTVRALVAVIFQSKGMASARFFVEAFLLSRLPLPPTGAAPPTSSSSPSSSHPLSPLLKFADPKRSLSLLCSKHGLERPQSRLLAETGRLSNSPVFGVGVYVGARKVGEGWGSSIKMSEFRAAEDALRRVMLTRAGSSSGGRSTAKNEATSSTGLLDLEEIPSATLDDVFQGALGGSRADSSITSPSQASDADVRDRDIWSVGEQRQDKVVVEQRQYKPRELGQSEIVFGSRG